MRQYLLEAQVYCLYCRVDVSQMTPGCPTIQAAKISAGFVQVIPGCGGIIPGVVFKAQIKPDSAIRSQ
ncbi:MAG: hypothetical protein MUP16_09430 [Sedimentisphaerales bacterium]|nr:hypothetical protein [Sedimentisphaerales bacterium]